MLKHVDFLASNVPGLDTPDRDRGSMVDRGLTFGTTPAGGVCVLLARSGAWSLAVRLTAPPGPHAHRRGPGAVRRVGAGVVPGSTDPTMPEAPTRLRVLVAGATGYIGRRLVAELVAAAIDVRCLARTPGKLDAETLARDGRGRRGRRARSGSRSQLRSAKSTRRTTWSIRSAREPDWQTRDRTAAENFRDAAAAADVEQIVYLGGLGDDAGGTLSPHLASRHEVGRVLATGRVPLDGATGGGRHRFGQRELRDVAPPHRRVCRS